jgi:hypothetical protein
VRKREREKETSPTILVENLISRPGITFSQPCVYISTSALSELNLSKGEFIARIVRTINLSPKISVS